MAAKILFFYILMEKTTRGFLGALITNLVSNFVISKIKNGRPNMATDKLLILYSDEKLVKGVSRCTDHESVIGF